MFQVLYSLAYDAVHQRYIYLTVIRGIVYNDTKE